MVTHEKGFTLIELLIVIGLFATLSMFITVNMLRPQISSSVSTAGVTLVTDIKHQQLKSMVGSVPGGGIAPSHGVYFDTSGYTLFSGDSYIPASPNNFRIDLANGVAFSNITFPSSQLVFDRVSGEVSGFVSGSDSGSVEHSSGLVQKISINRYGAIVLE